LVTRSRAMTAGAAAVGEGRDASGLLALGISDCVNHFTTMSNLLKTPAFSSPGLCRGRDSAWPRRHDSTKKNAVVGRNDFLLRVSCFRGCI
jgi:hypothetical protein